MVSIYINKPKNEELYKFNDNSGKMRISYSIDIILFDLNC